MPEPPEPSRIPTWLAPVVVVMLGMQLVLTWFQGSLLHRQHQDLLDLREDVQILTDTVEEGLWSEEGIEGSFLPARKAHRRAPVRVAALQETEEEQARKELQESVESARKAVSQARETRSKLSIEENARKAEEKAEMEAAGSRWQTWLLAALGAGLAAMGVRAWLRRRGG